MYNKKTHIHFVGIGGIGMSGIAKILLQQGYTISGCDLDCEQKTIKELKTYGCEIYQGNNTEQCHNSSIDVVVYSSDIMGDNPEIIAAQQRTIPTIPRAVMLAELMRTKYSIAVAGSHGKTTTTSLIAHIFMHAQYDPTVVIGGHLKSISTNAYQGAGSFLIAEADESDKSLVYFYPTLAVITNIDREHMNVYKNIDDIKATFLQFLSHIPFYGKAVVCYDDPHVKTLLPLPITPVITYGLHPDADLCAQDYTLYSDSSVFTVISSVHKYTQEVLGQVKLNMPGVHNIWNALAAIAISLEVGIPFTTIASALADYKGVERRFCFKGITQHKAEVFDDYGHHPTEIHYTLLNARRRAKNKLIVVFQPHRYTRTYHLWEEFIKVFSEHSSFIDTLIITDIHAASEKPIDTITSQRLTQELINLQKSDTISKKVAIEYIAAQDNFKLIHQKLDGLLTKGDLVLLLGAGKINSIAQQLINSVAGIENKLLEGTQASLNTNTYLL